MLKKMSSVMLSESRRRKLARAIDRCRRWKLARAIDRCLSPFEFIVDSQRYLRHCTPAEGHVDDTLRGRQLECQLTKDYHRVEKGLALSAPKPTFGADVDRRLAMLIPVGVTHTPQASFVQYAQDARSAVSRWNSGNGIDDRVSPRASGMPRAQWTPEDAEAFLSSRHSVRHFDPSRSVPAELLNRAVGVAATTPSVCNRQSWKVRFFRGDRVPEILEFQNGNTGFRHEVPCVAVVTVDTRLFAGVAERNQPWIDGGLFSMSLVYALHGRGVQTCMLNMSVRNSDARKARKALGADDAEAIIMMIAIGYAPEEHRVARSPRRSVHELVEIIG